MDKCTHPNCLLKATKLHPSGNRGLCDTHYTEVVSAIKYKQTLITLTCTSDGK